MIRSRRPVPAAAFIALLVHAAASVNAGQTTPFQPNRPIEVVVHTGPGGGSDLFARAIAAMLGKEKLLAQRLQIVNKPGGSGAVAMAYLAGKIGSTHTIGFFTDVWVTTPLVQKEARFTLHHFTPIALLIREPGAAVVPAPSTHKTMAQLVETAKKNPGRVRQAGGSVTSVDNLIRVLIQKATGASWAFISFPSGGERTAALLGGHADLMLTQLQEVREQLRAGRLRVIAAVGDRRLPALPDVPTLKEQGIDIPAPVQFRGVVAPPGVPAEAVQYWENLVRRLITTPGWKSYVRDEGLEESFLDSRSLVKFWNDQTTLMRRALSEGGIRAQ